MPLIRGSEPLTTSPLLAIHNTQYLTPNAPGATGPVPLALCHLRRATLERAAHDWRQGPDLFHECGKPVGN